MKEPGDGRLGKRTWETAYLPTWEVYRQGGWPFKMNNGSSDIHVVRIEYSGYRLELKNTETKKWRLRLSPLSRCQLFSLFFLCTYTLRAEAPTWSPGSYRFPYWKARRPSGRGCRGPWIDPVSLSPNKYGTKKINWKPSSGKSQEKEVLQKTDI